MPSPVHAQERSAAPAPENATPWPVLDDGRVVFTVYGVKIAMPTCPACLNYTFFAYNGPHELTVRDTIAHPERLRAMEAGNKRMRLRLWNLWREGEKAAPFLGRFDAQSLPQMSVLDLLFSKQVRTDPCWDGPPDADCLGLHELDVNGRRPDQVTAGMNVTEGPFVRKYPRGVGYDVFIIQRNTRVYLAPADYPRDAIGLPVRFECDVILGVCYNSPNRVERGYALSRQAEIIFSFTAARHPPEDWLAMHDRVAGAVRTLFIP